MVYTAIRQFSVVKKPSDSMGLVGFLENCPDAVPVFVFGRES